MFAVVDEMHNARNHNKTYWSLFGLRQTTRGMVGMTATPVLTRPQVRGHTLKSLNGG